MSRQRKVTISLRIEAETYESLNELAKRHFPLTRSDVIRKIVDAFYKCTSPEDIWEVLSSWDSFGDGLVIKVMKKGSI